MSELDDHDLLVRYARENSEAAFAALAERHVNLVYSVALRSTGNPHAAQEITQAVFIILANKAEKLSRRVVLSGWLYQTTRLTAANFLRGEIRRQKREQEAYMESTLNGGGDASSPSADETIWPQIAPLLDGALEKLGERDRNAIVLRFFENKSLREVGLVLGASEDAAKMRVNRALEKLRKFFTKRGVVFSATVIAGAVSANSVHAAPVGLAKTISIVAITKGAAAGGSTLALVKGALKIMAWTKMKTTLVIVTTIILAVSSTTILIHHQHQYLPKPQPASPGQTEFPKASWHFAGFADPESTYQSSIWAASQGNVQAIRECFSPAMQKLFANTPDDKILPRGDRLSLSMVTSYDIVSKQTISGDEVILQIHTQGARDETNFAHLKRFGNEWKIDLKQKR